MSTPSSLLDAMEGYFATEGLTAAFEPTGTPVLEWVESFESAILEFVSVFEHPSEYKNPEIMRRKVALFFERTVGILQAVKGIGTLDIAKIKSALGNILKKYLFGSRDYEKAISIYRIIGIDLVQLSVDLLVSVPTVDDISDFLERNRLLSDPAVSGDNPEDSIVLTATGSEIRLSKKSGKTAATLLLSSKLQKLTAFPDSIQRKFATNPQGLLCAHASLSSQFNDLLDHPFDSRWCSSILLHIQESFFLFVICHLGNAENLIEDFVQLFCFAMPENLFERLERSNMLRHFMMTLLYPNVLQGKISEFKKYLVWMDRSVYGYKISLADNLDTDIAIKLLVSDYSIKKKQERNISISSPICAINGAFSKKKNISASCCFTIAFSARYQSYLFASQKVSPDTVYELLRAICHIKSNFLSNDPQVFVKGIVNGFYNKDYFPDDFIKMVEIAATVISESKFSKCKQLEATRLYAITRWFMPWYGVDFMDGGDHRGKRFVLTGKDFISMSEKIYAATVKQWNLEKRGTPVTFEETRALKDSILSILDKTDFDKDMVNLAFSKNTDELIDTEVRNVLLYFIKQKLEQVFVIKLPDFHLPQVWFEDHSPYRQYSGADPGLYPKWRDYAIRTLLSEPQEDKVSQLLSTLNNPLAAELELSLESVAKKVKSKGKKSPEISRSHFSIQEIFVYLDTQFKFKPENEWISSDLYKNIQVAISGISDQSDRKVAQLASTWKCDSFEEFMRTVNLLGNSLSHDML
jgi:hypothetical protein